MATSIPSALVDTIVVACEAGMGSSVMCVNALKKKLRAAQLAVHVAHRSARSVAADARVVLVHRGLADVVRRQAPGAVVIAFSHFLNDPVFDALIAALIAGDDIAERL